MHHQRGKSGNTSTTDVRRAVTATDPSAKHRRPAMPRRHTPVSAQKLGRSHRERDRDRKESWDDERESFPQFCMTCEKQFMPHDEKFLYCSETCRRVDQSSSTLSHFPSTHHQSYGSMSDYSYFPAAGKQEPRDIVPRASPSRPTSMHFNSSPPASPGMTSASTTHHQYRTSAISALRSLNIGPPSPPSPTGSSGSSIWPFGRSVATSPGDSYTRPSGPYLSSTYDGGYYGGGGGGYSYTYDAGPGGLDRPLPSRHPGAYSRPKSIELVTPVVGR